MHYVYLLHYLKIILLILICTQKQFKKYCSCGGTKTALRQNRFEDCFIKNVKCKYLCLFFQKSKFKHLVTDLFYFLCYFVEKMGIYQQQQNWKVSVEFIAFLLISNIKKKLVIFICTQNQFKKNIVYVIKLTFDGRIYQ